MTQVLALPVPQVRTHGRACHGETVQEAVDLMQDRLRGQLRRLRRRPAPRPAR